MVILEKDLTYPGSALHTCIIMGRQERREREREQRREQILEAARELLLEKGYYHISMRQIATLAELGVGTIYSYFKSKEDIYADLSTDVFDQMYDAMQNAASETVAPPEKIRSIAAALLKFSSDHRMYYDFLDYFISTPRTIFPPEMKERVDYHGNRILEPMSVVIREGMETGIFRKVNPAHHSLIFFGLVHGFLHFRKLQHTVLKNENFTHMYNETVDCFINGLKS